MYFLAFCSFSSFSFLFFSSRDFLRPSRHDPPGGPRRSRLVSSLLLLLPPCLFSASPSLHLAFMVSLVTSAVLAFAFYLALPWPCILLSVQLSVSVYPPSVHTRTRVSCIHRLSNVHLYPLLPLVFVGLSSTSNVCASPFKFYSWINHPVVLRWGECVLTKEPNGKKNCLFVFLYSERA